MPQKIDDESCCTQSTQVDHSSHWNKVYTNATIEKLGWYEEDPHKTFELIDKCNLAVDAKIFMPGAGSTILADELLKKNFTHIVANDISEEALISLRSRVGAASNIKYIVDDLTNPDELEHLKDVDLWIDRAVLHFFTKEEQQKTYFDLLKRSVKPQGFVILAQFNLEGAKKCSGLDVFNYNVEMLQDRLGTAFKLLDTFDHTYVMPSGGLRPYVYTLFQRK